VGTIVILKSERASDASEVPELPFKFGVLGTYFQLNGGRIVGVVQKLWIVGLDVPRPH
jgi:hypothetical protein